MWALPPLTELIRSLTITWPPGTLTTWLIALAATLMATPLITKPSKTALAPTLACPVESHEAVASVDMKFARIVKVAPLLAMTSMKKLLTDESDTDSESSPRVVARAMVKVSAPLATLVSDSEACRKPPELGNGPVSQSTIGLVKL